MTTRPRRRRGARLVEPGSGELARPFRVPETADDAEPSPPAPDPLDEAYARGVGDGTAGARAEAEERLDRELSAMRRELAAAVSGLADLEQRIRTETTSLMTTLALEAATRITREKIDEGDPIAARALAEALDALPETEGVTARVHPDDVASIRQELGELVERRGVELHADESVSRGGCVADSRAGRIDARLETAIESVRLAADGERA